MIENLETFVRVFLPRSKSQVGCCALECLCQIPDCWLRPIFSLLKRSFETENSLEKLALWLSNSFVMVASCLRIKLMQCSAKRCTSSVARSMLLFTRVPLFCKVSFCCLKKNANCFNFLHSSCDFRFLAAKSLLKGDNVVVTMFQYGDSCKYLNSSSCFLQMLALRA